MHNTSPCFLLSVMLPPSSFGSPVSPCPSQCRVQPEYHTLAQFFLPTATALSVYDCAWSDLIIGYFIACVCLWLLSWLVQALKQRL